MTLKEYLSRNGMTQERFAELAGVGQPTISRLVTGSTKPSWGLASKIAEITNGDVSANDFARLEKCLAA